MTPAEIIEFAAFDHLIYQQHIETMERHSFDFRALWIGIAAGVMLQDWQARGRPFVLADDEAMEDETVEGAGEDWNAIEEKLERADAEYDEWRMTHRRVV